MPNPLHYIPAGWTKGDNLLIRLMGDTFSLWKEFKISSPNAPPHKANEVAYLRFNSLDELIEYITWWYS